MSIGAVFNFVEESLFFLETACEDAGVEALGAIYQRCADVGSPRQHLGLCRWMRILLCLRFADQVACLVEEHVDIWATPVVTIRLCQSDSQFLQVKEVMRDCFQRQT